MPQKLEILEGQETVVNNHANDFMLVRALNIDFTTNAEAGERFLGYAMKSNEAGALPFVEVLAPPISTIGTDYNLSAFDRAGDIVQGTRLLLPLAGIALPPGWMFEVISTGKKAGDVFKKIQVLYELLS